MSVTTNMITSCSITDFEGLQTKDLGGAAMLIKDHEAATEIAIANE